MISTNEVLSIIPITVASLIYWIRDRYVFNQAKRYPTRTQWAVLLFVYPTAILLEWVHGLQTSRSAIGYIVVCTFGRTIVWHYTTVAIFNDAFVHTRQQFTSFFTLAVINYIWAATGVLLFGDDNDLQESQSRGNMTTQCR